MVVHHSAAFWAAAAIGLLSLCALPWGSWGLRPSDHGLAFQKNTTVAPPAMAAFFRGEGGGVPLPEARNATGFEWAARATPVSLEDGRDKMRRVLLAVAVALGAVGVGLLVAAGVYYLVLVRREKARRRGAAGEQAAVGATARTCEGYT